MTNNQSAKPGSPERIGRVNKHATGDLGKGPRSDDCFPEEIENVLRSLRRQKQMQEATEGAKAKAQRLAYAAGVLSGRRWVLEKASYSQLLKSEAILPGELWALMIRTYREVILNPGLVSMSTTGCSVSEKAFASAGQN